jgi:glycosyltransferase involved in cell wall biosynthesis
MGIVSALVCTRGRPGSLLRAVRSLLASDGVHFELLVIDQSDGPESEQALAALADPRLRYVRSRARGKGAALNEGLRLARGDIVALTDDDCEAPPGWAEGMARALEAQPAAAIAFCNVTAEPHDPKAGYVPAFERRRDRLVRSIGASLGELGLGAGMAVRRAAVVAIGGFDEAFGPGARFGSGDDWDLAHRVLLSGSHVYQAAHLSILHHGFRTFAEGGEHARRDWVAIGALCAKPLRAGHFRAIVAPVWYFSVLALWPPVRDLLRLHRPSGLSRIAGFVLGFAQGVRTPVDRKTLLFRPPAASR